MSLFLFSVGFLLGLASAPQILMVTAVGGGWKLAQPWLGRAGLEKCRLPSGDWELVPVGPAGPSQGSGSGLFSFFKEDPFAWRCSAFSLQGCGRVSPFALPVRGPSPQAQPLLQVLGVGLAPAGCCVA